MQVEGIEPIILNKFSEETASEFVERFIGKTDDRLKAEIFSLTGFIPLVLEELCLSFSDLRKKSMNDSRTRDTKDEIKTVKKVFDSLIQDPRSPLHNYCHELYTESLGRARGTSLLKIILKVLANEDELKLSEVSRRIYRSAPVTKSLLERLIEVDLIKKTGSTFSYSNPVLRKWCQEVFRQ